MRCPRCWLGWRTSSGDFEGGWLRVISVGRTWLGLQGEAVPFALAVTEARFGKMGGSGSAA